MAPLSQRFQGNANNTRTTSYIYPTIGVIKSIEPAINAATVMTSKGEVSRARLPLPFYSPQSGIFWTPSVGDACLVHFDSTGAAFIGGFYPLDPINDTKKGYREYPAAHTLKIKTKANDVVTVSESEEVPGISLKSPASVDFKVRDESDPDNVKTMGIVRMDQKAEDGTAAYIAIVGDKQVAGINTYYDGKNETVKLVLKSGESTVTIEEDKKKNTAQLALLLGKVNVIITNDGNITITGGAKVDIGASEVLLGNSIAAKSSVVTADVLSSVLSAGAGAGGPGAINFTTAQGTLATALKPNVKA